MTNKKILKKQKNKVKRPPSKSPKSEDLFQLGFTHYQAGRFKETEVCCRTILDLDQKHSDALHLLGMSYHQRGDDLNAIDCINRAISVAPDHYFYHLNLGNIYSSRKNHDAAEACHLRALELNPNFLPTIIHLALNLEQGQRVQEAIGYYKRGLSLEPENSFLLTRLGNALLSIDLYEESIATLRTLVKVAPGSAESYYNLGGALMRSGDIDQSIEQFKKSLQIRPDFVEAYYNLGRTLGLNLAPRQPLEEAISFYKNALARDPNNPTALIGLGNSFLAASMEKDSISIFRKLLKISPDSADSHLSFGLALVHFGCLDEAAVSYQQALIIRPEDYKTHIELGLVYKAQGKIIEAVTIFSQALVLRPDYLLAQTYLAIISWINNDINACRKYLKRISISAERLTREDKRFFVPYKKFLSKLVEYGEANPMRYVKDEDLPVVYIVGDSHCLAAANTKVTFKGVDYRAEAKLVMGCKAWHLGNNDKNRYKYEFEKTIESIPSGSIVVFMFGEIDCRIEEGIIKHYKNNKIDLAESIISLVEGYLDYILSVAGSKEIVPIICNVSRRLVEQEDVAESDRKLFEKVLALFNQAVENKVLSENIPILDVYAFSRDQENRSGTECHLDGNHLYPSVVGHLLKEL
ncbi:MAG: tetratricopeptide repeat protein [Proteobacteria bacterium]|nr:tetratricopeptide repeat protein [Pseudomonadota bacterium]MBU1687351.1 tetratricopeptide repeat protein [Pseudomonadota bacterium]